MDTLLSALFEHRVSIEWLPPSDVGRVQGCNSENFRKFPKKFPK